MENKNYSYINISKSIIDFTINEDSLILNFHNEIKKDHLQFNNYKKNYQKIKYLE